VAGGVSWCVDGVRGGLEGVAYVEEEPCYAGSGEVAPVAFLPEVLAEQWLFELVLRHRHAAVLELVEIR